jgi:hypothetical protein
VIRDPPESPLLDARNCLDGVEEIPVLGWVLDVRVDEKGVGLGMDVLSSNELCCLNFIRERVNAISVALIYGAKLTYRRR